MMTSILGAIVGAMLGLLYAQLKDQSTQPNFSNHAAIGGVVGFIAVTIFGGGGGGGPAAAFPEITSKTEFQQQVLESADVVLVDFTAEWCGACKQMTPRLNDLHAKGLGGIQLRKVDSDRNAELAQKYQIRFLPTMIAFKDGKEVERWVGVKETTELEQRLKSIRES